MAGMDTLEPRASQAPKKKVAFAGNWGSDAIVEQLSRLGLRYVALVPGSSYRGVHDSLVNYNESGDPEMLMCLHEEHCVAIAHGFAKVTERPMAAAVHANVGLMHATMAVYNAFCDRVPVVILGATGPLDAARRRPWIDWVHTATDQGALIRPFVKFDDQPHSVQASIHSLVRATAMASQIPRAPVYVCLDSSIQEDPLADPASVQFPTTDRYMQIANPPGPAVEDVERAGSKLASSRRPLFLFGRANRSLEGWNNRISLAERYTARVLTDLKQAASFPTQHRLHACAPTIFSSPSMSEVIQAADVIVSFDWVDLAGTLQAAHAKGVEPSAHVIHISLDSALHNGWSKDHFGHPCVDHAVSADADKFVAALLASPTAELLVEHQARWEEASEKQHVNGSNGSNIHTKATSNGKAEENGADLGRSSDANGSSDVTTEPKLSEDTGLGPQLPITVDETIYMKDLADTFYSVLEPDRTSIIRLPLGWMGADVRVTHPLAYLGQDGGGGIGSGPGMAVGGALALKDTGLLPVAVLGDGDFLMGSTALWTAARYRLPLLVIVANNSSFFNDEVHQERVARTRGRPVENRGVGIRIEDPLPDLTQHAASLGAKILGGQVTSRSKLKAVLIEARKQVQDEKAFVVVDVKVCPNGYSTALETGK